MTSTSIPIIQETPSGLFYFPAVISADLLLELQTWLESEDRDWFAVGASARSRRVMHFGFRYDYRSGSVTTPAPDMPEIILSIMGLIGQTFDLPPGPDGQDGYTFDQCIINRYEPGQGISAHIDRQPAYGPIVACFTAGSGAEMEFTRPGYAPYRLYSEPGSLYIMSGESRTLWRHAMRGRLTDPGHGYRGVRYSITFRSVAR